MIHTFEFVVIKKQTETEIAAKEDKKQMHLMYKTKSKRRSKVAELIKDELEEKGLMLRVEMEDFYIRELKK